MRSSSPLVSARTHSVHTHTHTHTICPPAMASPSRVLIFGGTGYIGKHIVRASLKAGHPTFVFVRPDLASDIHKAHLLMSFKKKGASLLKGTFEDHNSLVNAIKQVDVVITALGEKILLDQLKIIEAMKEAGSTKRFYPSEYGMDPDHELLVRCPSPSGDIFKDKRQVRRSVEKSGVPYTYVSANCFAGYFLQGLAQIGQFMPPSHHVLIYGDGDKKVVWNNEEDIAAYVIHSIEDPRAINKTLYIRPPKNVLSLNEVVSTWEEISQTSLQKTYIPESKWLQDIEETSNIFDKIVMGHFHLIFYRGVCYDFKVEDEVETSYLYPQVDYKNVFSYLQDLN